MKHAEWKFAECLRKKKLKLTPQRRTIFREAFTAKRHFTAEELLDISKKHDRSISKATLYRTLILLKECEMLDELDFGGGHKSYEKRHGRMHHDHMICVKCNSVMEFSNAQIERLQDMEAKRRGFKIIFHSHRLFGLCRRCR